MTGQPSGKLVPLEQQSAPLRRKIIEALRSAVETGMLQPGQRLVERDLCEQLGVSRTSLREALRELQGDGILSHSSRRGLVVSTISQDEAENVYRIRAALEALVVEQFIERADEAEREQLADEGRALEAAYRSRSVQRILTGKRAFYDRICSGAKNALALDIISRLVLRTSALRSRSLGRKDRQQESIREIEAILAAIEVRDVTAGRRAAITHVENAARYALAPETEAGAAVDQRVQRLALPGRSPT